MPRSQEWYDARLAEQSDSAQKKLLAMDKDRREKYLANGRLQSLLERIEAQMLANVMENMSRNGVNNTANPASNVAETPKSPSVSSDSGSDDVFDLFA